MRLTIVLLALLLVAPPAHAQLQRVPAPDDDPFYAVPANLAGLANGTVLDSREITPTSMSVPMPADAWQVQFKTQDNTGAHTAYVTTVMVPRVPWTGKGPRPVLSYQTAEDGVGHKCAPSFAIRGGLWAGMTNSTPETQLMLQGLLRGWTVVAPDYEGPRSMFLGAAGEARGVLDGLRAARAFRPAGIHPKAPIGAWGYSGGALATSLAAQLQPSYAPELKLSAVALGGVVADVKATMYAFSGSAFGGAVAMGLVAADRSYPEYRVQQHLNDAGRAAMAQAQEDCINDAVRRHPFARIEDYTDDPRVLDSAPISELFRRMSPLTFPGTPTAPVYHYHAVLDELAPIGPARELMARFCRSGTKVRSVEKAVGEHLTEVAIGWAGALTYLRDRFAGKPAPSTCAGKRRVSGRSARAR